MLSLSTDPGRCRHRPWVLEPVLFKPPTEIPPSRKSYSRNLTQSRRAVSHRTCICGRGLPSAILDRVSTESLHVQHSINCSKEVQRQRRQYDSPSNINAYHLSPS